MDRIKTVRELRNEFPRIEAWVHEGESINISKRGKVIATLVPALGAKASGQTLPKVDIMDILHVPTAIKLGMKEFLTFDANQKKLAEAEGLVVPF